MYILILTRKHIHNAHNTHTYIHAFSDPAACVLWAARLRINLLFVTTELSARPLVHRCLMSHWIKWPEKVVQYKVRTSVALVVSKPKLTNKKKISIFFSIYVCGSEEKSGRSRFKDQAGSCPSIWHAVHTTNSYLFFPLSDRLLSCPMYKIYTCTMRRMRRKRQASWCTQIWHQRRDGHRRCALMRGRRRITA